MRSGCVEANRDNNDATGMTRCSDPSTYLFFDDWQLGPQAMKMIGEGIAQDITSNRGSLGWFAQEVDKADEDKDEDKAKILPPEALPKNASLPSLPATTANNTSPPDQAPQSESQPTQ